MKKFIAVFGYGRSGTSITNLALHSQIHSSTMRQECTDPLITLWNLYTEHRAGKDTSLPISEVLQALKPGFLNPHPRTRPWTGNGPEPAHPGNPHYCSVDFMHFTREPSETETFESFFQSVFRDYKSPVIGWKSLWNPKVLPGGETERMRIAKSVSEEHFKFVYVHRNLEDLISSRREAFKHAVPKQLEYHDKALTDWESAAAVKKNIAVVRYENLEDDLRRVKERFTDIPWCWDDEDFKKALKVRASYDSRVEIRRTTSPGINHLRRKRWEDDLIKPTF